MNLKKRVFMNNLKMQLGIKSLDEINEQHMGKIMEYLKLHNDKEIISEIITKIPDFLIVAKESVNNMKAIISDLLNNAQIEIESLNNIITQLNNTLNNKDLSIEDKKEVLKLMFRFSEILENQLKENAELRKIALKGILGIAGFLVAISGYMVYKALGGKNGDEFIAKAGEKLLAQGKI